MGKETRIKVIPTKVGTAYEPSKEYKLLDYIVVDDVTVYICKKVDATTGVCKGHALTETDWWDKSVDLTEVAKANGVERIQQSLGPYTDRDSITITPKEKNVAISADGVKVSKSGWAIAEFTAEKGNEYLFKPNIIDGSVCLFAEKIDKVENRSIDYTYTYNEDGTIATATATYLGKTHIYTYSYSDDTVTITDDAGVVFSALPYQYQTSVGVYSPLVRLNADAELPRDGYCRFMSHFQGNNSLKVVVSYKRGAADPTILVVRDGVFASISTQLGNISQKESETRNIIAKMDEEHSARIADLEQAVGDLGGTTSTYYCASQDTSKPSPDLVNPQTNSSLQMLQDMYRPFLVDHTEAKEGVEVMPADELQRNNWLRYKNGKFAPAVGITEEMRAQCDVELYLDAGHTEKYCDAGHFDAEKFYNTYGFNQKLYDAEGNEIEHILRPWETTSKDYSIMVGDTSGTYLIDGYSTKDGEQDIMYKAICKSYREVAGIKPKYLAPTLLAPCQATSIKDTDGKIRFRSFPFLYNPCDDNTKGGYNTSFGVKMFYDDGCYPRVTDVQQITSMQYARNNNADQTKSYPFAETGFHAYNTFLIAHELLYGTNYINDPNNLFSSGVSSVDWFTDEMGWKKYGGVKYRAGDTGAWKCVSWSTLPSDICKDANGTKIGVGFSEFINQNGPKWRELEAQMVLSVAAERGIAEDTEFEVYGATYRYVTPPKAKGLADGYMNAIVYRVVKGQYQGYDASGNAVTWHMEANLRQGIMDGLTTVGDIFHFRGGGYEMVVTNHYTTVEGQNGQNDMDLYLETDQRKWLTETTDMKQNLGTFDFESLYEHIAHMEGIVSGWMKQRVAFSPFEKIVGGSKNTYVTASNENSNWYGKKENTRYRLAARIGGYSLWGSSSSRYLYANQSVLDASRIIGGSAQCLFRKRS